MVRESGDDAHVGQAGESDDAGGIIALRRTPEWVDELYSECLRACASDPRSHRAAVHVVRQVRSRVGARSSVDVEVCT